MLVKFCCGGRGEQAGMTNTHTHTHIWRHKLVQSTREIIPWWMLFLKHYVLIFKALNNDQLTGELGILTLKWKPWIGLPLPKNCLCLLCHSFLILVFRLVTDLALQFENLLWICNLQLLFAKIQCYRKEMGAKSTKGACHGDKRGWGSGVSYSTCCQAHHGDCFPSFYLFIYYYLI